MRLVKFSSLEFSKSQVRVTWTVVLLILHSHWNLLRPCQIVLPVTLEPNEIEFWLRLIDLERVTTEASRGTTEFERTVEIDCQGAPLSDESLPPGVDRWATAFSGGKDSLVQTALLCEMTERPLLVNANSPMPPLIDHSWPFRDRAMTEIRKRRDVELVVVKSNLRSIWPHYEVPHQLGYKFSMRLLGDTFFFVACTLAVATSRGVRSFALATEFENAGIGESHGRVSFFEWNMGYALPMLTIIDRLVRSFGMNFGSLLMCFNHLQLQTLLRKRYADLAELQISCFWMDKPTEQSCSRCIKCLRVAMLLLALDEDPATVGIDLERMFAPPYRYDPPRVQMGGGTSAYAASIMNMARARRFFPRRHLVESLGLRAPASFAEFSKVVDELAKYPRPHVAETHINYFRFVPDAFREQLRALSMEYWPEIDDSEYDDGSHRGEAVAEWVTETL